MSRFSCMLWLSGLTSCLGNACAANNWLTLAGDPHDPAGDYIQLDPVAMTREHDLRTIPVRISGAAPRMNPDGLLFRSVTGLAAIDCKARTARFVNANFYAEPGFAGSPFSSRELGMAPGSHTFRGLDEAPAGRVVRAACGSRPAS
ncbi:MAG: hypothetical protein JWQ72_636 [Polaromonas sp.]|nr:hypothetical protein [Polaromonas sp.]